MAQPYDPQAFESSWQDFWERERFAAADTSAEKDLYMLMMFPYPSGDLHVGHGRNYILGDCLFRRFLMQGRRVLNPMGWDAFGLPAENAAIKRGIHPREWTVSNIARMKAQFRRWGILYDWDKELASCEPDYYRWNQWLFLRMVEAGLAYQSQAPVNWCSSCRTVLANEQVVAGGCERCGTEVAQKELTQWFLRITAFADRLLAGLDRLGEWPEKVKTMQRNWIGRSEGCDLHFPVEGTTETITVFTTRVDTIYGATFVALAPEHPMVEGFRATAPDSDFGAFVDRLRNQPRLQREAEGGEKEGRFTGAWAVNPFSGEPMPIWVANFVLMEYGTGAIMSVPAHDQRDFEFATRYGLPIRVVVAGPGMDENTILREAYSGSGVLVNSHRFSGLPSEEAVPRMGVYAEEAGLGARRIRYRLRDWLISRQRYWGTPIPIIYCDQHGAVPVPEDQLPVVLPTDIAFGEVEGNPLAASPSFLSSPCPVCGRPGRRETDTMDTFMDSSWYFLRFVNPRVDDAMFDQARVARWLPVDLYIGGIEHAILHLLYARFIYKVLGDFGLVPGEEPFPVLFNQGMITAPSTVTGKLEKMSKSKGNVVAPQKVVSNLGADILRLWVASTDYRGEMTVSDEILKRTADAYRRIRNTARFLLANLAGFDPARDAIGAAELLPLDRWAVARAVQLQQEVVQAYDDYEFHLIYQKVHNFCSVDLGAFYLDVIKDRQYTTQRDSLARRSAQTALHHIVEALTRWLAPILSFTAEEIWAAIPGQRGESVFLATWYAFPALGESQGMGMDYWAQVMEVRELVYKELERVRVAGGIGSGLEAEVDLWCGRELHDRLAQLGDELRFVLITSYARVHLVAEPPADAQHFTLTGKDEMWVQVTPSAHTKCVRCWHLRADVGSHAEHPELCGRCVDNVAGSGEVRRFA